jgi:16S rRNA (guanine527-N7)-methyltransferase
LLQGLQALGLTLDPEVRERLLAFLVLLSKWNRAYNLTRVTEPRAMLSTHLLDSLAVVPYLHGERVLDVGTGPGLPGIPLALACPQRRFWLLDSNAKKTRFITQAVAELKLRNVQVVRARSEAYRPEQCFDTVLARAYAPLERWQPLQHLACADGILLAMKGAYPGAELETLPAGLEVLEVVAVSVPGLQAQRHLVRLRGTQPV